MRVLIVCCVTGLMLFAAGCKSPISIRMNDTSATDGLAGLDVAPELRYNDIPVPRGFVYLPKESWTYEGTEKTRLAELHYKGKASIQEAVDFFLEQMPISGWEKIMVVGPETKKRLRFKHTRKSDLCEVIIEKRIGSSHVILRIN